MNITHYFVNILKSNVKFVTFTPPSRLSLNYQDKYTKLSFNHSLSRLALLCMYVYFIKNCVTTSKYLGNIYVLYLPINEYLSVNGLSHLISDFTGILHSYSRLSSKH